MARKFITVPAIVLALIVALAACTSSSSDTNPSTGPRVTTSVRSSAASTDPTTSSPRTGTTSSVLGDDPRSKAAAAAYSAFVAASYAAERKPTDLALVGALNVRAVDPALATEGEHLLGYRNSGIAWAGQPPKPRVSVQAITATSVYPTVTLNDCPTVSSSWKPYLVKSHKAVPITYPKGSAKPPHAIEAKVIFYKNRWMVQSTTTNVKKTCAPS